MRYITGTDRTQAVLFPQSLDEIIDQDNEVRLLDLFVESLDLSTFSFHLKGSEEGRPAYHPKDLLKLYVYGYLNSVRSSRALEKECKRNIEVMWLLHGLAPDHNTISNFRRDNEKAIRKVFRRTVSIAKDFELIGGKLIAGDSTKLRAQNSKKNNFNEDKIERHVEYIERRLDEYNQALNKADNEESRKAIQDHMDRQNDRKDTYHELSEQLDKSGESQISTSDPESRQLMIRNRITEVAYNVQTTVDEKHKITLDYKVTNQNDSRALGSMLRRAKVILGHSGFTALFDKGYHRGSEISKAISMGVKPMVAVPGVASFAPDERYNVEHFVYDPQQDTYTCPQNNVLTTNGSWYVKSDNGYVVKHYKTPKCQGCAAFARCTRNKLGRLIERSEHQEAVDQNKGNIEQDPSTYKKRQAIIEHTYGTIKRQWGFSYILTKRGLKRASSDVGLMFTAYNLRRLMNSICKNILKAYLKELADLCFVITASLKLFSVPLLHAIFTAQFYLPRKSAAA
jgi:transposase